MSLCTAKASRLPVEKVRLMLQLPAVHYLPYGCNYPLASACHCERLSTSLRDPRRRLRMTSHFANGSKRL